LHIIQGAGEENPFTDIDTLIHEPARLNIIAQLYVLESADFLFLMRQTGLTFGNLSFASVLILSPMFMAGAQEPNGVFPNDPLFPQQWTLHNTGQFSGTPGADIRAPEAWEITTGDPNIVIAVVGDIRHNGPAMPANAQIYTALAQHPFRIPQMLQR
jgi:hypothetical protein